MAMIKSNQAEQMMRDVIVLDLGDLRRQADQIRAAAEQQAEQVLQSARQQAAQLVAGAEQRGYQAGLEAGRADGLEAGRQAGRAEALEQAREQLGQLTEAWNQALRQWEQQRGAMMLEARRSLMRLAVEIAARIVKRVPRVDPMCVCEQVAAAIAHVTGPTALTIRIHPEDRPLVEQALPDLLDTVHQVEDVHLVEDGRIARGGCVIDYGRGRIDATLEHQLERMAEALLPGQMDKQDLQRIVRMDEPPSRDKSLEPDPPVSIDGPVEPIDPEQPGPAHQADEGPAGRAEARGETAFDQPRSQPPDAPEQQA